MTKKHYQKIDPFPQERSKGTYDDFYNDLIYNSAKEAYEANDYVHADYVVDKYLVKHIEMWHTKEPDIKVYYRLDIQNCFAGIDEHDDLRATDEAVKLIVNQPF